MVSAQRPSAVCVSFAFERVPAGSSTVEPVVGVVSSPPPQPARARSRTAATIAASSAAAFDVLWLRVCMASRADRAARVDHSGGQPAPSPLTLRYLHLLTSPDSPGDRFEEST